MIGTTISHYHITAKLGQGGMGEVYLAEDTRLGRKVALKLLTPELAHDREALLRLRNEARAVAELSHPNIATLHDFDEVEGRPFLVFEYLDGCTLSQRVAEGPAPIEEVLRVGRALAEGMSEAHAHGIVHRDLKSQNVMLTRSGRVKILDFGLAHREDATQLTRPGTTMGTVAYMSPEQIAGRPADARSDLWAVGVVLYECLTGKLPFMGETPESIMYGVRSFSPTPPTALRTGIPLELEAVVLRCLEKDPELRFQHADDLLASLRAIATHLGAAPSGGAAPPVRRRRAGLVMAVLGPIVLVVLLVAAWFALRGNQEMRQPAALLPSIAVLYLENLGAAEDSDYFAAGMTEDIITELGNLSGLRVMTRSEVRPYRGSSVATEEIAGKLGVDYLLTGSLRLAGTQLRLNVELLRAGTPFPLWSDRYDRELADVFEIQADIARKIARAVEVGLSREEEARIGKVPTSNMQAYELYLRARQYLEQRSLGDNRLAADLLRRALELDPGFADAWVRLGSALIQRVDWQLDPQMGYLDQADSLIHKGLELDEDLADGEGNLGSLCRMRGRYAEGILHHEKAIRLRPHDPEILYNAGWTYFFHGDFDRVKELSARVSALQPGNPEPHRLVAWVYQSIGEPDSAEVHFRRSVELGPDFAHLHRTLALFYRSRGRLGEAGLEYEIACRQDPENAQGWAEWGWVELYAGDATAAWEHFRKAVALSPQPSFLFSLGQAEEALGQAEKARDSYQAAVPLYEESLEEHPGILRNHISLAHALAKLGRTDEARARLARAESSLPEQSILEQRREALDFAAAWLAVEDTSRVLHYAEQLIRDGCYDPAVLGMHPGLAELAARGLFGDLDRGRI